MAINIAIYIQIAVCILCFACIFLLATKRNNSYTNIMLLAFVCGLIQNFGYYYELTSDSIELGERAIQIQYLGGAFIVSFITLFMFKYCKVEIKPFLRFLMVVEGIIVLWAVFTWRSNHYFYNSLEYDDKAAFPHFVIGHSWLFIVFMVITLVELFLCLFVVLLSLMKTKEIHMRHNYIVLLCVILVPLSGFVLSILGLGNGYDATPATTGIAVILFGFSLAGNHVFDVADIAGEKLIQDMSDAIIVINNEGRLENANYKAKELYPEINGLRVGSLIDNCSFKVLFDEQRTSEIVINESIYDVHITPVVINGVEVGRSAVLFDITENRKQLEKMRGLMEAADEANLAKSTFLANVSHEIRTPINVIMGMSEVLFRDHRHQETDEYVLNIKNSAETLLALINDVLDFSKIESGNMAIVNSEYDMKHILQELSEVYKFRCEKKRLHFDILVPRDLPRYYIGDALRIRQILNNLISNAVKYTEQGSICLTMTGKYRSDFEMDLILKIEDTGIGIRQEDQSKLFRGFSRVDLRKTNSIQGTGLGLKITKQLVELMNGAINFKSVYEEGTTFSVIIPQKLSEVKTEKIDKLFDKNEIEKSYDTEFIAPDANILVVDDTKTNLIVVKELLKKTKVNIKCITSGQECLDLVKENHYDIIFLDHRMPGMDGIETYEKMQEMDHKCKKTPVIMLTANAVGDARDFYISKNFSDFLSKPVTSKQLIEMLIKYLPGDMLKKAE